MDLSGRTALVTGAARGIGKATAVRLAQAGADVAVADLDQDSLESVVAECTALGVRATPVALDQRDSAQVDAAFKTIKDTFGRLDIVANVAGVFPFSPIDETTDEQWAGVIDTNLTGVFYCSRAALTLMREQGSGSIINVASGAAVRGIPGLAAYAASKAGVIGFTRVLALEAAPNVRVNVVAPGPTDTSGNAPDAAARAAAQPVPDAAQAITNPIPLGRMAAPDEIAEAIAFFASDEASFIHGQVLHVNGGLLMP